MSGLAAGPVVKTKIHRSDKPYLVKWPDFLPPGATMVGMVANGRWFCLFSPADRRF